MGGVMKGLRSLPKNCKECEVAFNTCKPLCQTCVGRMTSVMIMMGHIIGQSAEKGAVAHKGRQERLKRLEDRMSKPFEPRLQSVLKGSPIKRGVLTPPKPKPNA